ncbi:MAG: hypothetical protein IJ480_09880 [Clostridia bacterium]|nr:hypothetical protein [Clostridia bacterium]
MIEFVNGTREQYDMLEEMLEDGQCHVYLQCLLPPGCNPSVCRIGFEKNIGPNSSVTYSVFIDKDIQYTGRNVPQLFRTWLKNGVLQFLDFPDIEQFFGKMKVLYTA